MKIIYERQKLLYENNVISKADYDDALFNYETAKNSATQRLSDLQRAETNLSYANIYAPISGVVLSRDIDEGQTVAASFNTPTLFTIAEDLKEMQVEADVDEADIGQVKEGQRVTFTVDAYIGETFEGEVTQVRLNPTVTSNVVTYTVVITAENPDLKLKPGLTATIAIYTLELKDVLTAEARAINFRPNPEIMRAYNAQNDLSGNNHKPDHRPDHKPEHKPEHKPDEEADILWVLDESGAISPRKVTLGASDGVNVQIIEGVNEGEKLIYSLKGVSESDTESGGRNESPFMPQGGGPRRM